MTTVTVNTYTHSVTYVSDNIMRSLKNIICLSGLNPNKFAGDWEIISRGLNTWLGTGDLKKIVLEVFNPSTNELVGRWDIDIVYGWSGEGSFWTDTEQIKYHIQKTGLAPSNADYEILVKNRSGRPDVDGWVSGSFRSTDGFVRHSLGSTISHNGLGAGAAYWRKNNANN